MPPRKRSSRPATTARAAQRSRASSAAPAPGTSRAPRRTQAERGALSHARLIEAAVELIAERGYRAASLQAIGERAGYSRGLVSHRFGSKEGMVKELFSQLPDAWPKAVGESVGVEALRTVARAHRDALLHDSKSIRAFYMVMHEAQSELPDLRDGFLAWDASYRARFSKVLRQGQCAGEVRKDLDVEASATLFQALLRGITTLWLLDDALDLERTYAELERMLLRTLAPEA